MVRYAMRSAHLAGGWRVQILGGDRQRVCCATRRWRGVAYLAARPSPARSPLRSLPAERSSVEVVTLGRGHVLFNLLEIRPGLSP